MFKRSLLAVSQLLSLSLLPLLGLTGVAQSLPIVVQRQVDQQTVEIEKLIQILKNWNKYELLNTPIDAADRLAEIGEPAIPYLVTLLQDSDNEVRGFASGAFRKMRESAKLAAVPQLVPLLTNTDATIRHSVLSTFGGMGKPAHSAKSNVLLLLNDPEQLVWMQAIVTLKDIEAPITSQMIERLTLLLKDWDVGVRNRATWALGEIGEPAKSAIPALTRLINNKDAGIDMRFTAVSALGKMGESAKVAIPDLTPLLKDPDQNIRRSVIEALGKIGEPAKSVVIAALKHPDLEVRFLAAHALGEMGPSAQSSIPDLVRLLKDPEEWARLHAVIALGKMGKPAKIAIPHLTTLLKEDPSETVRSEIAEALRKLE
jgi:HEAT repeat protein